MKKGFVVNKEYATKHAKSRVYSLGRQPIILRGQFLGGVSNNFSNIRIEYE